MAGATIGILFGRASAKTWLDKGELQPMVKDGAFGVQWVYRF
jgi:hypothetical protein